MSANTFDQRRAPVVTSAHVKVARPPHSERVPRGQALVEFALVIPLLMILVLAVADFGRVYTSLVAVEAAGREAADAGAFNPDYWNTDKSPSNPSQTLVKMQQLACSSAATSHLEGYAEPPGTLNHATCTNPGLVCTLERQGQPAADCGTYPVGAGGCGDPATDPPCVVHVQMSYQFNTFLPMIILPNSVTFTRDARFAVSGLMTTSP